MVKPVTYRILHLGLGAFHRAHQAWYINRLIEGGNDGWHIVAGNIRDDMRELTQDLAAQQGEYTLETVTPDGAFRYERIRAIADILPWSADLHAAVAVGRDPATRILSFTVTEAGYYTDQNHALDRAHPDLHADIEEGTRHTIYGAVAAILDARRDAAAGPITLLCCDNIRGNGERFRAALREFLQQRGDTGLLAWVDANTSFPNSMVDRITPRPPLEAQARTLAATGREDRCVVMAEDFCQWVIEDHFCNGRPEWENVGVQMVDSVLPYEEAKIRLLNATHSCIAWAGALRGYGFIHEALADHDIHRLAWNYASEEAIPCLLPSPVDLTRYRDTVLARFRNPWIKDTVERVASDGFAKIPGFILPTMLDRVARGESYVNTAKLPALFLLFLQRCSEGGIAFKYRDQAMDDVVLRDILQAADPVGAFCRVESLWSELAGTPLLEATIRQAYQSLQHNFMEKVQ
jgi:D-arabinitol 4-dehydrogenase